MELQSGQSSWLVTGGWDRHAQRDSERCGWSGGKDGHSWGRGAWGAVSADRAGWYGVGWAQPPTSPQETPWYSSGGWWSKPPDSLSCWSGGWWSDIPSWTTSEYGRLGGSGSDECVKPELPNSVQTTVDTEVPAKPAKSSKTVAPTKEDRSYLTVLNRISTKAASPGFGLALPPGDRSPPNLNLAKRVLDFVNVASSKFPEFGTVSTAVLPGTGAVPCVDQACPFWRMGHGRYMKVLARYINVLRGGASDDLRRELLADLGFHLFEDFVTEAEERELAAYWSPGGPVYEQGTSESRTKRRFFHYGPVLQLRTEGSSKSTLGIVPAQMGALPTPVLTGSIVDRIRGRAEGLGDRALRFDQLYVNHYSAAERTRIEFHHDNPKSMMGVVAGVSLCSDCELQLLPLDAELARATIPVALPRRSLYLLSGLSRYHLQHGIPVIRADRVSLTFRSVDLDCADRRDWRRSWGELKADEAANAHWPLLPPCDGQ